MHPVTVDAHIDLPWIMTKYGPFDISQRQPPESGRAVDFPRMIEGGLAAFFAALYLPDSWQDKMTRKEVVEALLTQLFRLNTDPCKIVSSYTGISIARSSGQIPILVGMEGGRLIGNNEETLETWAKWGVRYLTLTHNKNTSWANSATDTPSTDHPGLSEFGKRVVKRCAQQRIWIDVSHAHDTTINALRDLDTGTMVATHSGCRALVDHPRNLPDEFIEAESMTMIGVPFASKFIGKYRVADHIDHIVQLHGDHTMVGIGSDLDGAPMVASCPDVSKWKFWMDDLAKMGYNDLQIRAIAGGNWIKLL